MSSESIKRKAEEDPEERTKPEQPERKFNYLIEELKGKLQANPKTSYVDLSFSELDVEDMRELARLLHSNMSVNHLDFSFSSVIGGVAWYHILEDIIRENDTVKRLSLNNQVFDTSLTLSTALITSIINSGITSLDLSASNIDDDRLLVIASALRHNKTVTSISLNWGDFTDDGVECLIDMLKKNHTIVSMQLRKNDITTDNVKLINDALIRNQKLDAINKPCA